MIYLWKLNFVNMSTNGFDQSYEEVFSGFYECELCGYENLDREYEPYWFGDEVI